MIDAVPDDYLGSSDRALILAAAQTGLRQGELIALRWDDILWDQTAVRVRASVSRGSLGDPKSVTSKIQVPMSRRVAKVLHDQPQQDQGTLLSGNGHGRVQHMIGQGGGIVFHSLRHTFGTQMASAGAPLVAIKEWMGHADIQTTMIYAKWTKDREAERAFVDAAFSTG
ncbi:MAG: site-specific integrase [Solirubrobacterales bacterium]|nr:site-specific integrase [Solirubrobacterales bacterium]